MKLKLDENISIHLKADLVELGHDVCTVADEGLLGRPDRDVGAAAKGEGRFLLSLDVGFADLRKYPPGSHPGILLFRPRSLGPNAVRSFILAALRDLDFVVLAGALVVIEPDKIRIRCTEAVQP